MSSQGDESTTYPQDAPAPEGFPVGWKSVLKVYGATSKNSGMVYTRYSSIDGRHKNIGFPMKVFELHCLDHPHLNPQDMMETYQRCKANGKERTGGTREERIPVREAGISRFRGRCGPLGGPVALALAGWHAKWEYQPQCGQTRVTYHDECGRPFPLLKDIEVQLASLFEQGAQEEERVIRMVEEASRRADPELFSKCARAAKERQGIFTFTMDGGGKELEETDSQAQRALKRQRDEQQAMAQSKRAPARSAPKQSLHHIGITQEDFAASVETVVDARGALRGFQALVRAHIAPGFHPPPLLAAYGLDDSRVYRVRVHGVYRQLPECHGGRPCYQKLLHAPSFNCILGCDRIYILWAESTRRWQISTELADDAFHLAYGDDDVATPLEVGCTWKMQNGSEDFTEECGLALVRGLH